jgi:hypothetical protein
MPLHHRKIDHCPVLPKKQYKPIKENGKDIELPESIRTVVDEIKVTYNNKEQIELKMQIDAIKKAILSTPNETIKMYLALEGIKLNRAYTGFIELKKVIEFDRNEVSKRKCAVHGTHLTIYKMKRPNGDIYDFHLCRRCANKRQRHNYAKNKS